MIARDALVDAVVRFLGASDLLSAKDIRATLEREIDAAGADALVALKERLTVDRGWDYYPPDPLARRIHHALADRFLTADSGVDGVEQLAAIAGEPAIVFANHLSYSDANVIDVLLQRAGAGEVATRLTALAGPKVFTSRERRFSSLCFGTIKVPQSADVASEEAVLGAREVAQAARRAIDVAHSRLRAGDVLVLFGEGTRSRDGRMQRLLPAVARYVEVPQTWIVPVGLTGSETLFSIADAAPRPARVRMSVGRPRRVEELVAGGGDRRAVVDAIGKAIAQQLPPEYRGAY
ncbi:MAG TPA: lysophospholipid acyltransferase family protein [Vicinamibacterales bacterium]|nr:lysophospholipid acyltransferase family protein [Vicinamibacterales bacterium]